MGAAFAQQKPATPAATAPATPEKKANAVALDLFQLFKGFIASDSGNDFSVFVVSAAYERLVDANFSIGADLDLYFLGIGNVSGTYFSIAVEGRYYPMSENFEKLFLGAALGYNQLAIDGKTKPEAGGFASLITLLKMGYKVITSKNLYFEPSLAYVLSKSSDYFGSSLGTPLGWNGGLRFGLVF
jgi:hypothetical protein